MAYPNSDSDVVLIHTKNAQRQIPSLDKEPGLHQELRWRWHRAGLRSTTRSHCKHRLQAPFVADPGLSQEAGLLIAGGTDNAIRTHVR
jgi:hypothetical protein